MWIMHLQREAPVSVILMWKDLRDEIAYVNQAVLLLVCVKKGIWTLKEVCCGPQHGHNAASPTLVYSWPSVSTCRS